MKSYAMNAGAKEFFYKKKKKFNLAEKGLDYSFNFIYMTVIRNLKSRAKKIQKNSKKIKNKNIKMSIWC